MVVESVHCFCIMDVDSSYSRIQTRGRTVMKIFTSIWMVIAFAVVLTGVRMHHSLSGLFRVARMLFTTVRQRKRSHHEYIVR